MVILLGGAASTDPRGVVEKLRDLQRIEPAAVATLLGGTLEPTVNVTPYRQETPITLAGFRDARVLMGGEGNACIVRSSRPQTWCSSMSAARSRGLPHSIEPRGPHMPGVTHRCHPRRTTCSSTRRARSAVRHLANNRHRATATNASPGTGRRRT